MARARVGGRVAPGRMATRRVLIVDDEAEVRSALADPRHVEMLVATYLDATKRLPEKPAGPPR